MIVVTGATGQLGRLVIQHLLTSTPADRLVAAVRDPAKAADLAALGVQVREADYNRPATLTSAFEGARRVLLISSDALGSRVPQHRAVIDAAGHAGVDLFAYTSVLHADRSTLGLAAEHRETEAAIRASGLNYTMLRNGWYTENFTLAIPAALAHGAFIGAAGEGRIASAARDDYAAAAAAVLSGDIQPHRVLELAGDTSYTLADFAHEIGRQSGKQVPYVNLSETDYQATLRQAGLPDDIAELIADSHTAAVSGALFDDGGELSRLIGRPTTPMSATVAQALADAA